MTQPGVDGGNRPPVVSVVVPVYNDAERLRGCLDALGRQTYSGDSLEILVVDNGSEGHVADVVSGYERVRLLMEPRPGSYAARNRGVRESIGEIIAFTDADCVPSADWVERGVSHLLEVPAIGLLGGRIDVVPSDPQHPRGVELADMIFSLQQRRYVEELQFAATASAFSRKSVFERVGHFREDLMSGGDREWGERVAAAGYRIAYAEDVVITHPARRSLRQFYVKSRRLHAGARDHPGGSNASGPPWAQFFRRLVPPIRTAWKLSGDDRIPSRWAWLRLVTVLTTMRLVSAWLTVRFALGGRSPRK